MSTGDATQQFLAALVAFLAQAAAVAAKGAVDVLLGAFGPATEPDFTSIVQPYDRMLAIALLLIGAFIGFALMERMLGGGQGAGWAILPRVIVAVASACSGLAMVQYLDRYAALLATAWNLDFSTGSGSIRAAADAVYSSHAAGGQALGTAIGLLLVAFLTLLLAILVYLELILRSALILVTATFVPLVCAMWVWPRLSSAVTHLVEFLIGIVLSKFVIATAVYLGFSLVVKGVSSSDNSLLTGLAALAVAAFAPVVLFQGIRFGHGATANLSRSWAATGSSAATGWARAAVRPLQTVATRTVRRRQPSNSPDKEALS